jgi:hypothetical protein
VRWQCRWSLARVVPSSVSTMWGRHRTDAELTLLLVVAQERLRPGQDALDLGDFEAGPARLSDIADWTSPGPQVLLCHDSGRRLEESLRPTGEIGDVGLRSYLEAVVALQLIDSKDPPSVLPGFHPDVEAQGGKL